MKILIKNKINLDICCIVTEYETRNSLFANYIILIVKHGHTARTAWGETHTHTHSSLKFSTGFYAATACPSACLSLYLPLSVAMLLGKLFDMQCTRQTNQIKTETEPKTKPSQTNVTNATNASQSAAAPHLPREGGSHSCSDLAYPRLASLYLSLSLSPYASLALTSLVLRLGSTLVMLFIELYYILYIRKQRTK